MWRWITVGILSLLALTFTAGVVLAASPRAPAPQERETEQQSSVTDLADWGWLGVRLVDITERVIDHFGLTVTSGVAVLEVAPDSPAAEAMIQPGDVLVAIDGQTVQSADHAADLIHSAGVGTVVTLSLLRGSEELHVQATLAHRPPGEAHPFTLRSRCPSPSAPSALPPRLRRLLQGDSLRGLLHADFELLGEGDTITRLGVTLGTVVSVTTEGILIIERGDGQQINFQVPQDSWVLIGGYAIKLVGLLEGTHVLVVETEGAVTSVVAGPLRQLLAGGGERDCAVRPRAQNRHQAFPFPLQPRRHLAPDPEAMAERLDQLDQRLPDPERVL